MTPKGVEHSGDRRLDISQLRPPSTMTPKGVEHSLPLSSVSIPWSRPPSTMTPKGVEHLDARDESNAGATALDHDAERR